MKYMVRISMLQLRSLQPHHLFVIPSFCYCLGDFISSIFEKDSMLLHDFVWDGEDSKCSNGPQSLVYSI